MMSKVNNLLIFKEFKDRIRIDWPLPFTRYAGIRMSKDHDTPGAPPLASLHDMPGYLIRVARQRSMACFEDISGRHKITPQQYAILKVTHLFPGIDQNELGERVSLDGSTLSEMVVRMEQRGLLERRADGRSRRLHLTEPARALLLQVQPEVEQAQQRMLQPLTERERQRLLQLLSKLVGASNSHHQPRRRRSGA